MTTVPDNAITPAASDMPPAPGTSTKAYYRILGLVGFGFFVQTIGTDSGLSSLPLNLLLKDHLHLLPTAVATFSTIANVAWYLKPIAGAFADTVRIRGSRYRNYLLIGSAAAAVGWALMGVVPETYAALLITFIAVNMLLMLISTVLGGYMVTEGRVFQATGRLGSFRNSAMTAATLVAGPVGGFLASRAFGLTAGISAALLISFFVYVYFAVHETPEPASAKNADEVSAASVFRNLKEEIQPLLQAKTFWAAVGMTLFVVIAPGFGTVQLYYQKDVLHFSDQFIGNLTLVSSVMGLIGGAAYILLCRRLSLRTMLYTGIVLATVSTVFYELYHSHTSALVIDGTAGLLSAIPEIALFDLAARASPLRSASLSYSLLMAVYNFGAQMGNIGGSWLHDHYHVSFFTLVWINAGTTLLTLVAVPFLPRQLVETADGEQAEAPPDVTEQ